MRTSSATRGPARGSRFSSSDSRAVRTFSHSTMTPIFFLCLVSHANVASGLHWLLIAREHTVKVLTRVHCRVCSRRCVLEPGLGAARSEGVEVHWREPHPP